MKARMAINDIGPKPQSFNIEHATKENTDYRSVAWSGRCLQVTLMSIPVGGDIGLEAHPETDQFLRLDAGHALISGLSSSLFSAAHYLHIIAIADLPPTGRASLNDDNLKHRSRKYRPPCEHSIAIDQTCKNKSAGLLCRAS
jgi:hypothetical protein